MILDQLIIAYRSGKFFQKKFNHLTKRVPMKKIALTLFLASTFLLPAQTGYWQQHVDYTMKITMDTEKHQFTGTQELVYTNNSPDTLKQVFYHLYFNAFQPGSMMDVRSLTIKDPDRRIQDRISKLKPDEIGYQKVTSLLQNGNPLRYEVTGTILQVTLAEPILPGQAATFSMVFNGQVPVQIRRSGRNNKEDIDYTMTQWYPKMAEYDRDGWHPDQYIGREFYGVWGNFDVKIELPTAYTVAGTGVLQNAQQIGRGYASSPDLAPESKTLLWHFKAANVHDFAWAADPDFVHDRFTLQNGTEVHLVYNPRTANVENWQRARADIEKFFLFMNAKFGTYTYPQFSLIQGGDGGMEYPMCTMMLGGGKSYKGFLGLFVHEAAHSWFYGMMASNEQRYPWLDEGFTTFAEEEAMNFIFDEGKQNPHLGGFANYVVLDSLKLLEPLSTPADLFTYNSLYGIGSYSMGELFLMQMQYIVGDEAFWKGMRMYYNRWAFKHPKPEDFIKVMEEVSGMQLDWFLIGWAHLTKSTDYAIDSVLSKGASDQTEITLRKIGQRAMPVDVAVTLKDGTTVMYTIPLVSMYGVKDEALYRASQPWPWTNPKYTLNISEKLNTIQSITIDPNQMSCDINTRNNTWTRD